MKIFCGMSAYDLDLIKWLVQYHHPKRSNKDKKIRFTKSIILQDPCFIEKTVKEKERAWKLLRLIRRADSYSSCERDLKQNKGDGLRAPLDSIFAGIHITPHFPSEEKYGYHIAPLNPLKSFPAAIEGTLPIEEINNPNIKKCCFDQFKTISG